MEQKGWIILIEWNAVFDIIVVLLNNKYLCFKDHSNILQTALSTGRDATLLEFLLCVNFWGLIFSFYREMLMIFLKKIQLILTFVTEIIL